MNTHISNPMTRDGNKYIGQFIDGLRFLVKLNKEYRKTQPDFSQIESVIRSNQSGGMIDSYQDVRNKALQPLADHYLGNLGGPAEIANRCHALSHGFFETWRRTDMGEAFPLAVTIGNVFYRDENIYGLSKSALKKILNEGRRPDKSLDVHVWLTLDDMTVLDLSIISTLITREQLSADDVDSLVLVWSADHPGEYWFEPILVDNDFFNRVEAGELVFR